jgi:hypothetical protein
MSIVSSIETVATLKHVLSRGGISDFRTSRSSSLPVRCQKITGSQSRHCGGSSARMWCYQRFSYIGILVFDSEILGNKSQNGQISSLSLGQALSMYGGIDDSRISKTTIAPLRCDRIVGSQSLVWISLDQAFMRAVLSAAFVQRHNFRNSEMPTKLRSEKSWEHLTARRVYERFRMNASTPPQRRRSVASARMRKK